MKKHRGLKRYYRNLEHQNEFDRITWLDLQDTSTWSENWHLHFDWMGNGGNGFKRRKPHLDKLFRHFQFLADQTKFLKSVFRLYAVIIDFHSSSDALFLHTASPNNSRFPFKVEDLSKSTTLKNKDLDAYINQLDGFEKLYGEAKEGFCLLYIKGIGVGF